MKWLEWLRRLWSRPDATAHPTDAAPAGRVTGLPTSSNRASSMHLRWMLPSAARHAVEVSATLTVVHPPTVNRLYFWALQASFERAGRHIGAAHLGLQWHPDYPGNTAANWGGYGAGGSGELDGSVSPRPSALNNANTRNYAWVPGRPYRLTIKRADDGSGWAGMVDGEVLRILSADGDQLTQIMVWSEVFARCDDASVTVRWSDFEVVTADGRRLAPTAVVTSYQTAADGGCDNTTAVGEGPAVLQVTNAVRAAPPGESITLSS